MLDAFAREGNDSGNRRRGAIGAAALVLCLSLAPLAGAMADPVSTPEPGAQTLDRTCPNSRSMLKRAAHLKDLAKRLAEKSSLRILAIGSSSTRGIGASSPANTYPARLEAQLSEQFGVPVTVTNDGVNGETADATIARLEQRVASDNYDLIIWQVGTNDAVKGGDENEFRAYLQRGVRMAKDRGEEMVLLDQQFFPSVQDPVRYERFVKIIDSVGEEAAVPVLSRYRLMKAWAEASQQDLRTMLSGDNFHMSDRGYNCLAGAMVKAVADLVAPAAPARSALPTIAAVPRTMTRP